MIEKIRIRGYKRFQNLTFEPNPTVNIFVGNNEAGKSTLLEAITLAMTGRINGRRASDELDPFWFNRELVDNFLHREKFEDPKLFPSIEVEVFLLEADDLAENFYGPHHSEMDKRGSAYGLSFKVIPLEEYFTDITAHYMSGLKLVPVEFYTTSWMTFHHKVLTRRPNEINAVLINLPTQFKTRGANTHVRRFLEDIFETDEMTRAAQAFRTAKEKIDRDALRSIPVDLVQSEIGLEEGSLTLAMDHSSYGSWSSNLVPHLGELPLSHSGQGNQTVVRLNLALDGVKDKKAVVLIEEPENHLSHSSLNIFLNSVDSLTNLKIQTFISTHDSFTLNRLGLDAFHLLSDGELSTLRNLSAETVRYFQKLTSYDTLRLVLCKKFVLVEGPSDLLMFDRFFKDTVGSHPLTKGIDVYPLHGLAAKRWLELANLLNKPCALLQDNDGDEPAIIKSRYADYLTNSTKIFISDKADGPSLEEQLIKANEYKTLQTALEYTGAESELLSWMKNNKTETALRLSESTSELVPPEYFVKAIQFIHE